MVAGFSYLASLGRIMRTTKISIAIDKEQLRLARRAAVSEGLSLSSYIARGLGNQLEDQQRLDAARELYEAWGPDTAPTPSERDEFLAKMARSGASPKRRKRRAQAA